jgi:Protein of unknown function (DUF2950)
MRREKLELQKFHSVEIVEAGADKKSTAGRAAALKVAAVAVLLAGCFATWAAAARAQQPGQMTFKSPEEASKAFATAAQNNDQTALLNILGPEGKRIVSSGDAAEDKENRANFAQRYQEMHRFMKEPDGTTTLYTGAENWPLPIPLERKGDAWYFDTEAGAREILYRRVGRNEMSTIRICQELVAAQKEYRVSQNVYAEKIFSDEGKHDGLYWKADAGEKQSPIGPLIAQAVAEGYTKNKTGPTPYRGYYYEILTSQGAAAQGGAKSYISDGKMTGGFAFVAYPAEYRSSGVMTFIVGPDGVVYRKDLGKNTAEIAKAMKEYNPNATWHKDEDQQEETASVQQSK